MADDSERALVARCQRGDQEAFRELVERYQRVVFGLLARTVANRATAEDLAQEAFLRVYRGLPFFRGEARLGTWIYRIVANLVAERAAHARPAVEPLHEAFEDGAPRGEPGAPDAAFTDLELRDTLEKALDTLPPQYRLVISAHYLDGMKYEDLAEALGVPLGTVKTHLHRAKRLLREHLCRNLRPPGVPASGTARR